MAVFSEKENIAKIKEENDKKLKKEIKEEKENIEKQSQLVMNALMTETEKERKKKATLAELKEELKAQVEKKKMVSHCCHQSCSVLMIASPCLMRVKNYFMEKSYFIENLESIFSCKYNMRGILDNDTDAILSRVLHIQNREPSSMYVPAVFMNDL